MKKVRSIYKHNNWLVVGLGVLVGLFILLSSTELSLKDSADVTEQTEAQDDNTEQTISENKVEALPSGTQATPDRHSYLIEEITSSEDSEEGTTISSNFLPSPTKVFKVLFRRIISPNAP